AGDPPRSFVAKFDTVWTTLAEDTVKITIDPAKDAAVRIELWENGKRSDRLAPHIHPLIKPNGEIEVATHECELENGHGFKIEIGDGLGRRAFFYEIPPALKYHVGPLPKEVTVKDGAPAPFYFLCVGKDCAPRPDELAADLAKRAEFALVL